MLITRVELDGKRKSIVVHTPDGTRTYPLRDNPLILPDGTSPHIYKIGNGRLDIRQLQEDFPDVTFSRRDGRTVAVGIPEDLEGLPAYFKNPFSAVELLRRQFDIPFSTIEGTDVGPPLTMEEFVALPAAAFDSEYMHWQREIRLDDLNLSVRQMQDFLGTDETDRETLVTRVVRHFNDGLGSAYRKQPLTFQVGTDGTVHYLEHLHATERDERIVTHQSDGAEAMVRRLEEMLSEYTILITQNGMKYDLLQAREFADISINGHTPRIESSAGFFRRVVLPNVYHIDLAPYSQHHFPFTIDNKFETILSLILGRRIEKKQSYDDLTRLTLEQVVGRAESAMELREYAAEDVVFLNEAEPFIKPMVYLLSRLWGRNPDDVCTTSKKSLAMDLHRWRRKDTRLWTNWEEYDNLDGPKHFRDLDGVLARETGGKSGDGYALCYVCPLTIAYKDQIRDENVSEIFRYVRENDLPAHQQRLARFNLLYAIEEAYVLPLTLLEEPGNLETAAQRYNRLLQRSDVQNIAGNFVCVRDDDRLDDLLEGIGFRVAEGRLLSFGKGSFALYDGTNVYKQGVDTTGRRGWRTLYEQELVRGLIDVGLREGTDEALALWNGFLDDLEAGTLDRERMIFFKEEAPRDYFNYSAPAQRQDRVRAYIEEAIRKGETFAKAKVCLPGREPEFVDVEKFLSMPDSAVFSASNTEYLRGYYSRRLHPFLTTLERSRQGDLFA